MFSALIMLLEINDITGRYHIHFFRLMKSYKVIWRVLLKLSKNPNEESMARNLLKIPSKWTWCSTIWWRLKNYFGNDSLASCNCQCYYYLYEKVVTICVMFLTYNIWWCWMCVSHKCLRINNKTANSIWDSMIWKIWILQYKMLCNKLHDIFVGVY